MNTDYEILWTVDTKEIGNYFPDLAKDFDNLEESELSAENFSFYTSVSAVFSSKIEGEEIDSDTFIKHRKFGGKFLSNHTKKIDDLYDAYIFAERSQLNKKNLAAAHGILTRNILKKAYQGKTRKGNMFVLTDQGKIEYVAALPEIVDAELKKLYSDLNKLLEKQLSLIEAFCYAAMLHLIFVKIHPFEDGNGRTARLLEKWFLAEKLGEKAWLLQSEKYYYVHHNLYYQNIRKLGLEYPDLDYSKASNFLMMLPQSLELSKQQ